MKKLVFGLNILLGSALFLHAGTVSTGKESKTYKEPVVEDIFRDTEVQVDVFGSFGFGPSDRKSKTVTTEKTHRRRVTTAPPVPPPRPTPIPKRVSRAKVVDSGPGFVVLETTTRSSRRVETGDSGLFEADHAWGGGVGLNYYFLRYLGFGVEGDWLDGGETIHLVDGNVFLRYPITFNIGEKQRGLAPYLFGGYGTKFDGVKWGVAHAGAGVEFRICPGFAIFVDGRYVFGHTDGDAGLFRSGVRFVF